MAFRSAAANWASCCSLQAHVYWAPEQQSKWALLPQAGHESRPLGSKVVLVQLGDADVLLELLDGVQLALAQKTDELRGVNKAAFVGGLPLICAILDAKLFGDRTGVAVAIRWFLQWRAGCLNSWLRGQRNL